EAMPNKHAQTRAFTPPAWPKGAGLARPFTLLYVLLLGSQIMASSTPKSSKRDLWFKFGRFITGVTIACFFLPFFGVSCDGMEVVHVSGADMVGGCKPGGMLTEPTKEYKGDRRGEPVVKVENVDREPLAIAALGLAVVVFGLSWVRSR